MQHHAKQQQSKAHVDRLLSSQVWPQGMEESRDRSHLQCLKGFKITFPQAPSSSFSSPSFGAALAYKPVQIQGQTNKQGIPSYNANAYCGPIVPVKLSKNVRTQKTLIAAFGFFFFGGSFCLANLQ